MAMVAARLDSAISANLPNAIRGNLADKDMVGTRANDLCKAIAEAIAEVVAKEVVAEIAQGSIVNIIGQVTIPGTPPVVAPIAGAMGVIS